MLLRRFQPLAAFAFLMTFAAADDLPKSSSSAKTKTPVPRIASTVDARATATLTDEEATQVSFAAGRVLKHISQSRDSIHEKKEVDASRHVEQGLKLLAIMDSVLPHYKVKTEIKAGEHAYLDEDDVSPRYVTLFDELERRDIISPIAQAKKESQLQPAKGQHAGNGSNQPPIPVAVSHVDLNYSTVKLDIALAKQMLERAKLDLQAGKANEADAALLVVQSRGVLFEYEEVDLPLEEAADNLKLAETEMKEGRTIEAKAALHVAIDQLKRYEKLVGDSRGAEVRALHHEITKLTNELEKGPPSESERKKISDQISQWWHGATKWFKTNTK